MLRGIPAPSERQEREHGGGDARQGGKEVGLVRGGDSRSHTERERGPPSSGSHRIGTLTVRELDSNSETRSTIVISQSPAGLSTAEFRT